MVNLEAGTINLGGEELPIKTFEVWFRVPTGLAKTREFAVECCRKHDFDPRLCIVAVVIATTEDPAVFEELGK